MYNPDFDDFDDDDSFGPGEEDCNDILNCEECGKEFEVSFGETPTHCPFCGTEFV